jgi:hypothetical protein
MSEGIHQLSYSIQVPAEGEIDDNTDDCRMFGLVYALQKGGGVNLV